MLVRIHLAVLVSAVLPPSISSLELEAFLHSGKENEALIVSKLNSANDIAYREALEHLKETQDYRFLMELGINHIEIGGRDTVFEVGKFEVPSEQVVEESVGKLRTALHAAELHGLSADDVIPLDKVKSILGCYLRSMQRKLHRIDQITFLVERFEAFNKRFASSDNVNGYVNHDQTRTEQLDTVYRILYGHKRPNDVFLQDFNLAKINLAHRNEGVLPRKLTIPYHKARNMLSLAIDAAQSSDMKRFSEFRLFVLQLGNKYAAQVREYSAFIGQDAPTPPTRWGTLIQEIRAVQTLRRQALDLYESFILPFPNREKSSFSIYLHDPEERGLRFYGKKAVAFSDLDSAKIFAREVVIPSFKEVPEFYFTTLRDVVLFREGPVGAETLDSGRSIALFDNGVPFDTMMHIVRHECGHVLHFRMGYHEIRNRVLAISRGTRGTLLSPKMHDLLSRVHNLFFSLHPLRSTVYEDYKDAIYNKEKFVLSWMIDRIFDVMEGTNEHETKAILEGNGKSIILEEYKLLKHDLLLLTTDEKSILRTVTENLRRDIGLNKKMRKRFYGTFLGSDDDSIGHSSYYSMSNVDEDVAELLQQLGTADMREGLFARTRSDAILEQKVDVLLESFDKKLVHRWRASRGESQNFVRAEQPVTVVTVSENGEESLEVIKSAKSYVAQRIRGNQDVSFLSLKIVPQGNNHLFIPRRSNTVFTTEAEIVFFSGRIDISMYLQALEETLNHKRVTLDGRDGGSKVSLRERQAIVGTRRCVEVKFGYDKYTSF